MRRRFRRSRRRSLGNVIQSYKKVLNIAPTSRAASTDHLILLVRGQDSVAAGQTSVTDANVPTGAIIKFIEIEYSAVNLVDVSAFHHLSVQRTDSGQSPISSNAVGGDPQRNQVHLQAMMSLAPSQNNNRKILFKIPAKFQRVKEGSSWWYTYTCDQVFSDAIQIIYKFYR